MLVELDEYEIVSLWHFLMQQYAPEEYKKILNGTFDIAKSSKSQAILKALTDKFGKMVKGEYDLKDTAFYIG